MEFLDDYEAQVGWESDGVQSLREQDRVSDADLQVWREWAAAVTEVTVRRAGRSRSPRRVSGDDVSLCDRSRSDARVVPVTVAVRDAVVRARSRAVLQGVQAESAVPGRRCGEEGEWTSGVTCPGLAGPR